MRRTLTTIAVMLLLLSTTVVRGIAATDQEHYRWRNNDGSESTASYAQSEDTKFRLVKNTVMRLRFLLDNHGSPNTIQAQLQVAETGTCSSGSYNAVTTAGTGDWQIVNSSFITDGEATTDSSGLTNPGGSSFTAGEVKDAGNTTANFQLKNNDFAEIEFVIKPTDYATAAGDYCFRLYNARDSSTFTYNVYAEAQVLGPTAIGLVEFEARAAGHAVEVFWQTGQEVRNRGFHLYRSESADGGFERLNAALIPGESFGGAGQSYTFTDHSAVPGRTYYYLLEDVDYSGRRTRHGPVCVDWDGDGLPDDWEEARGFNRFSYDPDLDADSDGLSNLEEYGRGTDPLDADTDGDGVFDANELKEPVLGDGSRRGLSRGVCVLSEDDGGLTLELHTQEIVIEPVWVGGQEYERVGIGDYVHGYTQQHGYPQLPLKGLLVDLPAGISPTLRVLDSQTEVLRGYRPYPVPVTEAGAAGTGLAEHFVRDESAYESDAFYPEPVAVLGERYLYRGGVKQRLILHPLQFNPATGELRHHRWIRLRLEYAAGEPPVEEQAPAAWSPPAAAAAEEPSTRLVLQLASSPFLPLHPVLSALSGWEALSRTLWRPPADGSPENSIYRIGVGETSLYRLSRAELLARGIEAASLDRIVLGELRLYHRGLEQALLVTDVNGNDRLDAEDSIDFYGRAVDAVTRKYGTQSAYFLTTGYLPTAALRMQPLDCTPAGGEMAFSHTATVVLERDETYMMAAPGDDDQERWFFNTFAIGDGITHPQAGQPAEFELHLPAVADDGTGRLTISLFSLYEGDHEAQVALNGLPVETIDWSGRAMIRAVIEPLVFAEGTNAVGITCTSGEDYLVFDRLEVSYSRGFGAEGNRLGFRHAGGYRYRVEGFETERLRVWQIGDAAAPRPVSGASITGGGPFTVEFEPVAAGSAPTDYLVLGEDQYEGPLSVQAVAWGDLADTAKAADWILITHRELGWDEQGQPRAWLSDLCAHRQARGLRVQAVDIQDIYDEFGYGMRTPHAIKAFLAYAYENWQSPAPRYVLLVGDTSYDYCDHWGLGTANRVPGYLMVTDYLGETISDQWFVQVSGADALPDMAIGRLPAADWTEAAVMVEKIVDSEQAVVKQPGWRKVALVADNQSEPWEAVFETMNEQAAALVPESFSIPERFYLQQYEDELLSVEVLSADLFDRIDAGALVVNYSGHGALALWGAEKILDNRGGGHREDVMRLSNTGRYPFVISMSCLNGYFAYPEAWTELYGTNYHSLGEGLLRAPGAGAAAALMPTGMSTADGQQVLDTALFEALFTEDVRTLGDAIQLARQQLLANGGTAFAETSDTFVLLGDPAMELVHPLPRRVKGLEVTRTANGSVRLDWQPATDCFGKPVEGYWIYRRRGPADAWQRLNTGLVTVTGLVDAAPTAAVSGHPYTAGGAQQAEYAVTAVDADGDESVMSAALSAPRIGSSGNGSSGGGGCFISASRNPGKAQPLLRCIPAGIRRSFFWLALLPAAFIFETVLEPWRLSNEDKNRRQI